MSTSLQMLLTIAALLVAAKLAGSLSRRCGLPSVFGELMAGLLLGPTALGLFQGPFLGPEVTGLLAQLSELGVILLMFLAGLETDLAAMRRVGWAAFTTAVGGVAVPFAAGVGVSTLLGLRGPEAVFMGTILTATSVSITAETLMELGHLRSKEGTTILGAAVLDDVLGVALLSAVVALLGAKGAASDYGTAAQVGQILVRMVVFVAGALLVGRFLPALLDWVGRRLGSAESLAGISLALILFYAWAAEFVGGLAAMTGAYLLGVILSRSTLAEQIEAKLRIPAYGLLVPLFFVHIGLSVDARELWQSHLAATVVMVVVAIATKLAGAGLGALIARFQPQEALRVGVGMVSRGEVALIMAATGLQAGILQERGFALAVAITLITTLVTPPLLRVVFRRSEAAVRRALVPAAESAR